ncbi:hypothetical protein DFH09DRAFT_1081812 [Mycena vulgaris]|nr:hypothetical protein DFH09DRAFT_1081812 [Mycena vulgaris]
MSVDNFAFCSETCACRPHIVMNAGRDTERRLAWTGDRPGWDSVIGKRSAMVCEEEGVRFNRELQMGSPYRPGVAGADAPVFIPPRREDLGGLPALHAEALEIEIDRRKISLGNPACRIGEGSPGEAPKCNLARVFYIAEREDKDLGRECRIAVGQVQPGAGVGVRGRGRSEGNGGEEGSIKHPDPEQWIFGFFSREGQGFNSVYLALKPSCQRTTEDRRMDIISMIKLNWKGCLNVRNFGTFNISRGGCGGKVANRREGPVDGVPDLRKEKEKISNGGDNIWDRTRERNRSYHFISCMRSYGTIGRRRNIRRKVPGGDSFINAVVLGSDSNLGSTSREGYKTPSVREVNQGAHPPSSGPGKLRQRVVRRLLKLAGGV